jgi:hypothetical protein
MAGPRVVSPEQQAKILEGRRRALPFAAIAEALGVTEKQAQAAFDKAIRAEAAAFDPETLRQLDLSRLDRMTQGLWADASTGSPTHVDRMLALMDARNRMLGAPASTAMVEAFDRSIESLTILPADQALVESGRRIAARIDSATGSFDPTAETKAMYLVPHLMNVLRELGATPAARAAVKTAKGEQGGKLQQLRALRQAEDEGQASGAA